jgi:hypothetical protein
MGGIKPWEPSGMWSAEWVAGTWCHLTDPSGPVPYCADCKECFWERATFIRSVPHYFVVIIRGTTFERLMPFESYNQ